MNENIKMGNRKNVFRTLFSVCKKMLQFIHWGGTECADKVGAILHADRLILCTTDTVPGLLALATAAGRRALDQAKARSGKPYLLLAGSGQQAHDAIDWSRVADRDALKRLIDQCWPGPLTLIVPAHPALPDAATQNGTVAIRVPDHEGLRGLAQHVGLLFSTSANREGEQTPCRIAEVDEQIMGVDAIVSDDDAVICSKPSTIIDCTGEKFRLIRVGAYPIEDIVKIVPISTGQ